MYSISAKGAIFVLNQFGDDCLVESRSIKTSPAHRDILCCWPFKVIPVDIVSDSCSSRLKKQTCLVQC